MKYIAVKLKGLDNWIWFEKSKTVNYLGVFCGTDGWGKNGERTSIKVKVEEIFGEMESDKLQYSK